MTNKTLTKKLTGKGALVTGGTKGATHEDTNNSLNGNCTNIIPLPQCPCRWGTAGTKF